MSIAMWVILSVYLGGSVAVLGITLADESWPDKLDGLIAAAAWPIAWGVVLFDGKK